jgi:ligand-binding sensor domain-containing protein/two-component sensor histidine kinase
MKSRLLHFFATLFLISNLNTAHAQFNAPRFQRITIAEGLPNGEVHQIREDKDGFMWFGTAEGICRFDGYKIKLLTAQKGVETKDLTVDRPIFFCWDAQSRWWIGGDWSGIRVYDPLKHTLFRMRDAAYSKAHIEEKNSDTLSNAVISVLFHDKKSKIWIGSYEDGIDIYDLEKSRLDKTGQYGLSMFKGCSIKKIEDDAQGNIWVAASNKGLWRFDVSQKQWSAISTLKDIRAFSFDKVGGVWFTSSNQIFYYNPITKATQTPFASVLKGLFKKADLYTLFCDHKNRLWVCTDNGLLLLQHGNIPSQIFKHDPKNSHSLLSNYIREIFEDHKGNIWLACSGEGVCMIPNGYDKIQVFDNPTTNYAIQDVAVAPDSMLYAVTPSHILSSSFPYYRTEFTPIQSLLPCPNATLSKIVIGKNGRIYVATSCGIWQYFPKEKKCRFVCAALADPVMAQRGGFLSLNLWGDTLLTFGLYEIDGLTTYDLKRKKIQTFNSSTTNYDRVFTDGMLQDNQGVFWSNTFKGFSRLGTSKILFDTCQTAYLFAKGDYINNNNAGAPVLKLGDALLWGRADGGGLNVMYPKDSTYRYFSKEQGLFDNSITSLVLDKAEHIWAGTYLGISRIQVPDNLMQAKNLLVQNFSFMDGLPHNTVTCSATNQDKSLVFVGTSGGLAVINTEGVADTLVPKLIFNNLYVLNALVNPQDTLQILTKDINETDALTLTYNQTFFTLELSGLNFENPLQTRYAYRLLGLNNDWIDNGFRNTISFNNIAWGNYILEIKAQGSNGLWSDMRTLTLNISPPFWQRWWFIGGCMALISSIVYAIYRYRINQLKKVQDLQNSIAADLHDDIGSALSNIEILGFLSQNQVNEPQKVQNLMQKIAQEAKKTNESLHQLVWTMQVENAGLEPTLAKLNRMAVDTLEPQGISLSIEQPTQDIAHLKLDREKQRDLIMIYKETLTNISKHAKAKAVHIHIMLDNGVLHIAIEDNGEGIKNQKNKNFGGNGLKNMHTRMVKYGGSAILDNRLDEKGTVMHIRLPI